MGIFSLFSRSPSVHTPAPRVVDVSRAGREPRGDSEPSFSTTDKVVCVKDGVGGGEEFANVEVRSLTYAEVASLRGASGNRIQVPMDDEDVGYVGNAAEHSLNSLNEPLDAFGGDDSRVSVGDSNRTDGEPKPSSRPFNIDLVSEMEYGDRVASVFSHPERIFKSNPRWRRRQHLASL
uniref:ARAD1A18326p n=1 Tax=Blastobotrys adeninivorans TaxID=409370 RepID=A0A060SYN4_BLAAD